MKYVKLFESWLTSLNEAEKINLTKLGQLKDDLGFRYSTDEAYSKSAEALSKHLVKVINDAVAKNKNMVFVDGEGKKLNLTSKITGKEITLSVGSDTFKFTFEKDFTEVSEGDDFILAIEGKATVDREYVDNTTLSQFIYATISKKDIIDTSYATASENLLYIFQNDAEPKLAGKKGAKNISKMSIQDFKNLPIDAKAKLMQVVLGKNFTVIKTENENQFIVTPSLGFAKSAGIKFTKDNSTEPYGGRYLLVKLDPTGSDKKESVADLPVTYGPSGYKEGESFTLTDTDIRRIVMDKFRDQTSTTLASFLFDIKNIEKGGMKTAKGEKIESYSDLMTAMKADNNEAENKKSKDAWEKEGGPADMSLGAAGSSSDGMA